LTGITDNRNKEQLVL